MGFSGVILVDDMGFDKTLREELAYYKEQAEGQYFSFPTYLSIATLTPPNSLAHR